MTTYCFRLLSSFSRNNNWALAAQYQRLFFTELPNCQIKAALKRRRISYCVQLSIAASLQGSIKDLFVTDASDIPQQIKENNSDIHVKKQKKKKKKQIYVYSGHYFDYDEEYLEDLFAQFGTVDQVDINSVNNSHGYAVITFHDSSSAQKALLSEKITLEDDRSLVIKQRKRTRTSSNKEGVYVINGLPYDITVKRLKDYLSSLCDVDRIHLMIRSRKIKKEKDKTSGNNYAIALLKKRCDDIVDMDHQLDDYPLTVSKVAENFRFRGGGDEHKKLFIEGLPKKISEIDLHQHFQKFGAVRHVYIDLDRNTKITTGNGYVHFTQSSSAQDAANVLIQELNGSPVRVRLMGFQSES